MVDGKKNNRRSSTPTGAVSVGKLLDRSKKKLPIPPADATPDSLQYDLFTKFYGNEQTAQTNSVEFLDAIPKFTVHRNKQLELREDGDLKMHRGNFVFRDQQFSYRVQPAYIAKDGKDVAFYPAGDEELVWEVIKKLFCDQAYGYHDTDTSPTTCWVRFSLSLIRTELGRVGHQRSIAEVRQAVDILRSSVISVLVAGKKDPIFTGTLLSETWDLTQDDYIDDKNPKRGWYARLPQMMAEALGTLEYRQLNYEKGLKFKEPLARWMQQRFTHRWTNVSIVDPYHIALSTVEEESDYLTGLRPTRKIARMDKAFKELNDADIVGLVEKDVRRENGRGRKISNVVWTVYPGRTYSSEQKAANARLRDARTQLQLVENRQQ